MWGVTVVTVGTTAPRQRLLRVHPFPLGVNSLSVTRGMLHTPEHAHNGQQSVGASEGRFVLSHR